MAVFEIVVGVALRRPPGTDQYRKVLVEASTVVEAKLVAAQIAACTSTMPVSTELAASFDMWQ